MSVPLEIDGSKGGGQLLRSAVALSAIADRPVRIESIRGDRPTTGLAAQHLAAVQLAAEICNADVSDLEVGTDSLTFRPGRIEPGDYDVDVGTAGSVWLLFDTVLPFALLTDGRISVTATGGTDVKWAPSTPYYRDVKLPLLRSWGLTALVEVDRYGLYPAGGGLATLTASASDPPPLDVTSRGSCSGARLYSIESTDLAERSVAERQATAAADRLADAAVDVLERVEVTAESASTGSSIAIRLEYDLPVGFDALGEPGTPAEAVGIGAADRAVDFTTAERVVDRHMADQLLLPLAIAGGRLALPARTDHVRTSLELFERFGVEILDDGDDLVCETPIEH